jgi:hypothetical protein
LPKILHPKDLQQLVKTKYRSAIHCLFSGLNIALCGNILPMIAHIKNLSSKNLIKYFIWLNEHEAPAIFP